MKPINVLPFLSLLLLLSPSSGNAAGSMLRIACDGSNKGADVEVNGKFKGECPLDLQVPEGTVKLVVRQAVDDLVERVFVEKLRIGDGVVKKVDVKFSILNLRLTEKGGKYFEKYLAAKRYENEQRANSGDLNAMMEMASGTELSTEKRVFWLRKAADAGHPGAMYKLGALYERGEDVPKSLELCKSWYLRAAEAGDNSAMSMVASGYALGKYCLEKDGAKADSWELKAFKTKLKKAQDGDPISMADVGRYYLNGLGVEENPNEGRNWLQRAAATNRKLADAGDGEAPGRLAVSAFDENGERMSPEQRKHWSELSVEHLMFPDLKELREFVRSTEGASK